MILTVILHLLHACLNLPLVHMHVVGFKGENSKMEVENHRGQKLAVGNGVCIFLPTWAISTFHPLSHTNSSKMSQTLSGSTNLHNDEDKYHEETCPEALQEL